MSLGGLAWRMWSGADARVLWKFGYNFGYKGVRSVQKFKKRLARDEVFPPFLYISIVNSCNLRCTGCWVDVAAPQATISRKEMNRLIANARSHGNSFFGILGGEPFLTERGELSEALASAIQAECGVTTELSTTGGTSDARFIAPTGTEVVELGPINATIHQVDERINCAYLDILSDCYEQILVKLLTSA